MELPDNAIALGNDVWYTRCVDKNNVWVAIIEYHYKPGTNELCCGYVAFDVVSAYVPFDVGSAQGEKWTVNSFNPLDLSPSLLCTACNHHGFIRQGVWVVG